MARGQQKSLINLTEEQEALTHFETASWPKGPICVHCGSTKVLSSERQIDAAWPIGVSLLQRQFHSHGWHRNAALTPVAIHLGKGILPRDCRPNEH